MQCNKRCIASENNKYDYIKIEIWNWILNFGKTIWNWSFSSSKNDFQDASVRAVFNTCVMRWNLLTCLALNFASEYVQSSKFFWFLVGTQGQNYGAVQRLKVNAVWLNHNITYLQNFPEVSVYSKTHKPTYWWIFRL